MPVAFLARFIDQVCWLELSPLRISIKLPRHRAGFFFGRAVLAELCLDHGALHTAEYGSDFLTCRFATPKTIKARDVRALMWCFD